MPHFGICGYESKTMTTAVAKYAYLIILLRFGKAEAD